MPETQAVQWAFLFRQDRCTGCGACVMACRAWHGGVTPRIGAVPPYLAADDTRFLYGMSREERIRVRREETGMDPTSCVLRYTVNSCMHCSRPGCAAVCPVGRIVKSAETGIVYTDEQIACIGCDLCRKACPWEAPQMMRVRMTKCDFCRERLAEGLKPACVAACPLRALEVDEEAALLRRHPGAINIADMRDIDGRARYGTPERELRPHFWIIPR